MSNPCNTCNGRCCRYFCFEIDKPDCYEEFEDIRWYLLHEGIHVHIDEEGDWCIEIPNPCTCLVQVDGSWVCSKYDDRPLICRRYSPESCDVVEAGYEYLEYFTSADQLDAYARRMLGEEAYEKAKVRARAKAEAKGKPKSPTAKAANNKRRKGSKSSEADDRTTSPTGS